MLDRMLDSETRDRDLGMEVSPPPLTPSVADGPGFDSTSPQRSSKPGIHRDAAFDVIVAVFDFAQIFTTAKGDRVI